MCECENSEWYVRASDISPPMWAMAPGGTEWSLKAAAVQDHWCMVAQTSLEGYTLAAPAARPAACVRNNSDNNQGRQFYVIAFPTFSHSTPLHCAIRPLGTLFSFLSPPPSFTLVCWDSGLG